ncbi:hypothetical protein GDO81_025334 [Engystomops pustulosus]|uniref:Uncharacterized protein n=1 Tax=Engystomops pustulosus TaxID=76066 RepID=A0AAV6Z424_ENGPU|nr:hypothetical protein GDO81_025334 [Engystomops pustulosus]
MDKPGTLAHRSRLCNYGNHLLFFLKFNFYNYAKELEGLFGCITRTPSCCTVQEFFPLLLCGEASFAVMILHQIEGEGSQCNSL